MTKNELLAQAEALETVLIGARGGPGINAFGASISCTAWVQQFGEPVAKFLRAQAQATPEPVANIARVEQTYEDWAKSRPQLYAEHTTAEGTTIQAERPTVATNTAVGVPDEPDIYDAVAEFRDKAHGVEPDVAELGAWLRRHAFDQIDPKIDVKLCEAADALTSLSKEVAKQTRRKQFYRDTTARQANHIAELEAERDALKADAERYRWLRQNMTHYNPAEQNGPVLSGARIWYHASDNTEYPLDAAIDAAMK